MRVHSVQCIRNPWLCFLGLNFSVTQEITQNFHFLLQGWDSSVSEACPLPDFHRRGREAMGQQSPPATSTSALVGRMELVEQGIAVRDASLRDRDAAIVGRHSELGPAQRARPRGE